MSQRQNRAKRRDFPKHAGIGPAIDRSRRKEMERKARKEEHRALREVEKQEPREEEQ